MTGRTYTKDNADQLFEDMKGFIGNGYIGRRAVLTMRNMLSDGRAVSVVFERLIPEESIWDGVLYVNFPDASPKAADIINGFLSGSLPDEISFESDTQLRLWWD